MVKDTDGPTVRSERPRNKYDPCVSGEKRATIIATGTKKVKIALNALNFEAIKFLKLTFRNFNWKPCQGHAFKKDFCR